MRHYYAVPSYLVFLWIVDPGDVSPSSSPFSSALLTLANVLEFHHHWFQKKNNSFVPVAVPHNPEMFVF